MIELPSTVSVRPPLLETIDMQPLLEASIGNRPRGSSLVELAIALAAVKAGSIPGTVGSSGDCFSPSVATEAFPGCDYNSILMLSNAFGGAHGAMMVRYE